MLILWWSCHPYQGGRGGEDIQGWHESGAEERISGEGRILMGGEL